MTKPMRKVHVPPLPGPGDDVIETGEIEEFHSGHEVQPGNLSLKSASGGRLRTKTGRKLTSRVHQINTRWRRSIGGTQFDH